MAKGGGSGRVAASKALGISVGEVRAQRKASQASNILNASNSFLLTADRKKTLMRDINNYVTKYVNRGA